MGANVSYNERGASSSSVPHRAVSTGARYSLYATPSEIYQNVNTREKKKKASKFATLRKKLIRARRSSRSLDHTKVMKELTSSWGIREVSALVEEYEASLALKELSMLASLARCSANSCKDDLSALYDYKYCTDVDLVYQGVVFPVHRAIVCIRCPYFRDLLSHYPESGCQVPVMVRTPGIDSTTFSMLLRYLYTGEFCMANTKLDNVDVLVQLSQEFGTLNTLEHDLRNLLETGHYSDAVLVFSHGADGGVSHMVESGALGEMRTLSPVHKHELRCHKAILAARSPFFRNLLLRRVKSGEELTERSLHTPTCIMLDESVIPRCYGRVLLQAMYLDTVDLSCVLRSSVSMGSLSEVQAIVAGKGHLTLTDEATEIYQIAQFLDFPALAQGCEDVIAESLSVDNLLSVLQWSEEPHGSAWVHRQALHFLQEEFLQVARSPVLNDLSKPYLLRAIQSPFTQAGELDVLNAVLKWGEHQLIRRIEEREPNLLTHTAHSISRKGVKRRDLNDVELREILAELLPHIRTDHILPPQHEQLTSCIKRGLLSVPPSHMMGDGPCTMAGAWVRCGGKANGAIYIKPRLFTPYYEEAKALLDEKLTSCQEKEAVHLRMMHSAIPDTLYMLDEVAYASVPCRTALSTAMVDVVAGTVPMPSEAVMQLMLQRESELLQSPPVRRAYIHSCADPYAIAHQVQLRVVREFGLPDSSVEVLHLHGNYERPLRHHTPIHRPSAVHTQPRHSALPMVLRQQPVRLQPPSPLRHITLSPFKVETGACGHRSLSDMMPDIAMATASMNQMSLAGSLHSTTGHMCDLELDLGDGGNHSASNTMFI